MVPLLTVKKKLPGEALELFEATFTPSLFNDLLLSFRVRRQTTFRINRLKIQKNEAYNQLRENSIKFKDLPLIENAFIYDGNANDLLKTTPVEKGLIYLQSISSMLPVFILSPSNDDYVLDIAAAPGSKTTLMSSLMNNKGIIDAVEPDFIRMERLKYNAKLMGAKNINFFQEKGENFCVSKNNVYDKILADVPCSGEGRFSIYDKNSYGSWRMKNVLKLAKLQKNLLKASIRSTKIGGKILYSTCTLNKYENENIICEILENKDFKVEILPVNKKFKDLRESIKPFIVNNHTSLNRCLRIMPSKRMEGFFICLLQRTA